MLLAINHGWPVNPSTERAFFFSRKITEVNGKHHGRLMWKLPTATEWLAGTFGQVHLIDACLRILG